MSPHTTNSDPAPPPTLGAGDALPRNAPAADAHRVKDRVEAESNGVAEALATTRERRATTEPANLVGGQVRWWLAVVAGLVVSTPFVWLLSFGASLPYYLGLFFFVLFGLFIGAVMHRVAAPNRPYRQSVLLVGTTIVVMAGWSATIVFEARGFPDDMAEEATKMARRTITNVAEFRAAVADDVRRFLSERYRPGGTLGYVRWVLTSGELKRGQIVEFSRTFRQPQSRVWWAVRVVLSLALFAFGIGSQTLLLKHSTEHSYRAVDAQVDS